MGDPVGGEVGSLLLVSFLVPPLHAQQAEFAV